MDILHCSIQLTQLQNTQRNKYIESFSHFLREHLFHAV